MRIETSLGTLVAVSVITFIGGEIYGYMKCKEDVLKTMINERKI